jgi:hypothetical protein
LKKLLDKIIMINIEVVASFANNGQNELKIIKKIK